MKIAIISDTHIDRKYCDTVSILRFICECEEQGVDYIIAAGDIVDLQYMDMIDTFAGQHDLLLKLFKLIKYYIPGNHDFEFSRLSTKQINNVIVQYPYSVIEVDGLRWFITHGHYYGYTGFIFKSLKLFQDKPLYRKIAKWVVNRSFLSSITRTSKKVHESIKHDVCMEAMGWGCRVAICGHTHIPEKSNFNGLVFINPGSAIKKFTYVMYDNGKFESRGF